MSTTTKPLEKAATSHHNGNLWSALMPFTERETACRYRDTSLDAQVDVSWVSFVATANDDTGLPAPAAGPLPRAPDARADA
jgi:ATP-dependent Lon protease